MSTTSLVVVEDDVEETSTDPVTVVVEPVVEVVTPVVVEAPSTSAVEIVAADLLSHAHARIAELEAAGPVIVEVPAEAESAPEPDETPDRKHWAHRSFSELTGKS